MSDLIKREDAINALCDLRCGTTKSGCQLTYEKDGCEVCNEVALLEELPAAERWIPVSEGKPKDGEQVLVTAWEDTILIGYFDNDGKEFVTDEFTLDIVDADLLEVTAWRPLPEPYKGGEQ